MEDFYADHVTSETKTIKKGRNFMKKAKLMLSKASSSLKTDAQIEIFQSRGDFVELGNFNKLFVKNTRKTGPAGKILVLLLLDAL